MDFRKDTALLLAGYDQRAKACDDMLRKAFMYDPQRFLVAFDRANKRKFRRVKNPQSLREVIEDAIYLHGMGMLLQKFLEWTE